MFRFMARTLRSTSEVKVVEATKSSGRGLTLSRAPSIPTRRMKIEVANNVVNNFKHNASAAPELLESYVEPKPFINQKNFQLFTTFFIMGGASICGVCFLLSSSIAEDLEKEYLQADGIRESNERHATLLKEFVAPSSYKYLQDKMERRQEIREKQVEQVSILHSEVLYRVKLWWNRQLTLIDSVFTRMWERRKIRSEVETIRAAVAVHGYDLIRLQNGEHEDINLS